MDVRVNITVEVEQKANALAISAPVPLQLIYRDRRWQAHCEAPPVATHGFGTLEEAIIAGATLAAAELQAAVCERPVILARITPDNIPTCMF